MKKLVCCLVGLVTSLPLPAQSGTDYSSSSLKQRRECATPLHGTIVRNHDAGLEAIRPIRAGLH